MLERYDGRELGPEPHIVLLGSSKVGNFVVTVPLLQALRQRFPQAQIDFWGSESTADFENALEPINWRISWDSPDHGHFQHLAESAHIRSKEAGPVELLINCDGFNPLTQVLASWLRPKFVAGASLGANGRAALPWGEHPYQRFLEDPDWDSPDFLTRYGDLFSTNSIGELLCRLAFLEPPANPIRLPSRDPSFAVPDLLIHATTTRAAKIWPVAGWLEVLRWCELKGFSVGLVGSPPRRQQEEYHAGGLEDELLACSQLIDLRGRTSLIELAGACRRARAVVSVDAGPLHIAAAVGTPTLAVVGNDANGLGASPIRLWLPRLPNCQRTVANVSCDGCDALRFRNDECVKDNHECMESVGPHQVVDWLEKILD
ncbi:glycosyltransferase family 9 protein [Cyanobium sp. HWJ4-Hawea]|uniref:glycosyltransferase family 9 protein n=1 Tax=Cyanobium sp. HWJ4-Hawea TaxID=2823713 RepID=UPI0020CD296C|nr:glycosyltransferase family 9 protein [Cyanobium sp. HWJ4-Hawea]MCP9809142.1 glycosyltransferase family 9 protein [Cyanobium sp. HWJ4-Hawea]